MIPKDKRRCTSAINFVDSDLFQQHERSCAPFDEPELSETRLLANQINYLIEAVLVVAQEIRDLTKQLEEKRQA